jgi:hypothetical protein
LNRRTFVTGVAAASVGTPAPLPSTASTPDASFSPGQLRADLDALWQTLLDVGADPFRTSHRGDVEAAYRALRAGFEGPLTVRAFYLRVAALFAQLNDGHVDVVLPELIAYGRAGGGLFPLRFDIDDAGLFVRDGSAAVPAGSRVVAIDGRSESELRALAFAAAGAQTLPLWRRRARLRLLAVLYALDGPKERFEFSFRTEDGSERTISLAAAPAAEVQAATEVAYMYRTLGDGRVGYIDYRACVDRPSFARFLRETFGTIAASNVRGLVIDVRENGGGNSELNDDLWGYASGRPFKQFGGSETRSSARLKREYGLEKYVSIYGREAWDAPDGQLVQSGSGPDDDLVRPQPNPLRFAGRTVLLIGTGTFSSAMACATAAKDYELATLVGEETGEPVVSTGETYDTVAPVTGLRATFTTKVFFGPRPRPDRQGVLPDVRVVPTMADLQAGRDPVLARGIELAGGALS